MKWALDAIKTLSKNTTVPGVALADAVDEIEKLQGKVSHMQEGLRLIMSNSTPGTYLHEVARTVYSGKQLTKADLEELSKLE